jgi:hypothetical protein
MRALASLLLVLSVALSACGGAAATASPIGGDIMSPLMLDATTTTGSIKVNQFVVFKLDNPASWKLSADKPELVELVPGMDDGSSVSNPGAKGLKAGDVKITADDGTTKIVYSITITQ